MDAKELLAQLTLEEKLTLLTGHAKFGLSTAELPRVGVALKQVADGPNGERNYTEGSDSTCLPSCCATAATWNPEMAELMGKTIARDCIHHNISMILGPGANIKRNALNGRNFEYFAEDPYLAGTMAAAYINGCENEGVGTSMKHFACNSQETRRTETSVEIDERTLREIYLKAFEIAVKNSKPASIMCAYNKINSIWCGENKWLLNDVTRDEWGYEGIIVSDWGAVHDPVKSLKAGLDLRMPGDPADTVAKITKAYNEGKVSMEEIDRSALRVLKFLLRERKQDVNYDRDNQHENALRIAQEAVTVLKNNKFRESPKTWPNTRHEGWNETAENLLPLTPEKVKKIAVTGEYAVMPYINGQGSAEVFPNQEHIDSPLECLRKNLPGVQVDYWPHLTRKAPDKMLWHTFCQDIPEIWTYDAVLVFTGVEPSMDSENIDRFDNHLPGYVEDELRNVNIHNPNAILVLTSGSSTFRSDKADLCSAIVQMWPTGEAAGQAVADVLTGKVNPSGKLSETFPIEARTDYDAIGDPQKIQYTEKWAVGYRYYDLHPEKIWFPFGHGLSYTTFDYANPALEKTADGWKVSFDLTNTGKVDGAEVAQLYVGDPVSTASKPVKELKRYTKVFLKAGETKRLSFGIAPEDLSYYNIMLHDWIAESGRYDLYIAASARDIRLKLSFVYDNPDCYTLEKAQEDMIGTND